MCNKGLTYEGALVELNRLKSTERLPVNEHNLKAAVAVARAAILKQIKRKPINQKGRFWGEHNTGNCPICAATVNSAYNNYCRKCGQALDWSESYG